MQQTQLSCRVFLHWRQVWDWSFFCDAIFDPSEVFDHCAQLIDTLCKKGLNPTVLVLQTDCGLNYSLKGTSFQLVLMFVFNELDLNHFVTLRCASNGSARNIVEHSMSILNLPLAHVALKQGKIPDVPILEQTLANAVVEDLVMSGIVESVEAAKLIDVVNATAVSDTIL